jgi:hypothetical protein
MRSRAYVRVGLGFERAEQVAGVEGRPLELWRRCLRRCHNTGLMVVTSFPITFMYVNK